MMMAIPRNATNATMNDQTIRRAWRIVIPPFVLFGGDGVT